MKTGYSHTSPNVERDEGTHQRWRYGPITLRREYAHYLNVHICKGEIVAASGTQVTCAQQYGLAKHGLATDVHTSLSWLIYLDLYFWDHCHEKVWDFWCFSVSLSQPFIPDGSSLHRGPAFSRPKSYQISFFTSKVDIENNVLGWFRTSGKVTSLHFNPYFF